MHRLTELCRGQYDVSEVCASIANTISVSMPKQGDPLCSKSKSTALLCKGVLSNRAKQGAVPEESFELDDGCDVKVH